MARTDALKSALNESSRSALDEIEWYVELDSTNVYLKAQPSPPPGRMRVVLADHQTAGRGRHERVWLSDPGGSLCLSIAYGFKKTPNNLPALTLALGVGAAKALTNLGAEGIQLKWPNDILVSSSKLGGILTETQQRGSATSVVVGVGINMRFPDLNRYEMDVSWSQLPIDLASVMKRPVDHAQLSATLIDALFAAMQTYDAQGFSAFVEDYRQFDGLHGRPAIVETPDGTLEGTATGVAADGALLLETENGEQRITTGSIRSIGAEV